MRILVTGMSGLIGSATRSGLERDHELTALNRSDVDGVTTYRADITDFDAIRPAFDGQEVVVHLAANPGENYRWEQLRDTNIEGTRHVFQAAVEAGVTRVVFASSGATVAGRSWPNCWPGRGWPPRRTRCAPLAQSGRLRLRPSWRGQ